MKGSGLEVGRTVVLGEDGAVLDVMVLVDPSVVLRHTLCATLSSKATSSLDP